MKAKARRRIAFTTLFVLLATSLPAAGPQEATEDQHKPTKEAMLAKMAKVAAAPAFDRFGYKTTRYRLVTGEDQDLGEAILWWNEKTYLADWEGLANHRSNYPDTIAKWEARKLAFKRQPDQWSEYCVSGRVIQVLTDSLLVAKDDHAIVMLKNHPKQETLVDGDTVAEVAVPVGRTNYVNTAGATSTVKVYDFGLVKKK